MAKVPDVSMSARIFADGTTNFMGTIKPDVTRDGSTKHSLSIPSLPVDATVEVSVMGFNGSRQAWEVLVGPSTITPQILTDGSSLLEWETSYGPGRPYTSFGLRVIPSGPALLASLAEDHPNTP